MPVLKVYVCFTSEDLLEYRQVARSVINKMGWKADMMEDWGAMSMEMLQACYEKLRDCDLMVLIVAFRRGWVPTAEQGGNGEDSISALELNYARKNEIPVLALLAKDNWPGNLWNDDVAGRDWIKRFREELNVQANFFDYEEPAANESENLPEFRALLTASLAKYRQILGPNSTCAAAASPDWREVLQTEIDRLPIGRVAFNPPDTMKVGVKERVETRISRDLYANLLTSLKGRGFPKIEELVISELMKVRLSAEDFDIVPLNEEEQIIAMTGFTEWAWDVIPRKSGNKILHLHVTLRIKLPFGEEKKDHPVLDKEISVRVNPIYSVKSFILVNWKWIATALIVPLIGWIWKKYIE